MLDRGRINIDTDYLFCFSSQDGTAITLPGGYIQDLFIFNEIQ